MQADAAFLRLEAQARGEYEILARKAEGQCRGARVQLHAMTEYTRWHNSATILRRMWRISARGSIIVCKSATQRSSED